MSVSGCEARICILGPQLFPTKDSPDLGLRETQYRVPNPSILPSLSGFAVPELDTRDAPLQGLGTRDNTLIRIMVSRSEIDMLDIREVFRTKYDKSLHNMIKVRAGASRSPSAASLPLLSVGQPRCQGSSSRGQPWEPFSLCHSYGTIL